MNAESPLFGSIDQIGGLNPKRAEESSHHTQGEDTMDCPRHSMPQQHDQGSDESGSPNFASNSNISIDTSEVQDVEEDEWEAARQQKEKQDRHVVRIFLRYFTAAI